MAFLLKTLNNPIRSISRVVSGIRFFESGALGRSCNMREKRNIEDHKRRLLVHKYELRRNLYRAMCRDPDLPTAMLEKCRDKLSRLPRNSAPSRVRTRCIFTGRPRAVYRKFKISRIVFRELANKGDLDGVKKASW